MKRIITSASLVALGAVSLQAQYEGGLASGQQAKPWSVAASLRGFYDDNYTTSPKAIRRDSFGIEVRPSAAFNWSPENRNTTLGLSYMYGMRWYEDRTRAEVDHSHQINGKLAHAFTDRFQLDVSDSFVIAQEPEVLATTGGALIPFRSEGDNIRNTVNGTLTAKWTDQFSTVLGYSNTFYNYEEESGDTRGDGTVVGIIPGSAATGISRSALLDRIEHLITLNLRWQFQPKTVGLVGYHYEITDYTSSELISEAPPALVPVLAENRDSKSHYAYVGVDQGFLDTVNASLRVGAQFREYDDPVAGIPNDEVNPYVDGNITWQYLRHSYAQLGARHSRTATDVAFASGTPVMDAETTAVYTSLNHKLFGDDTTGAGLTGSLMGQFQHSSYDTPGDLVEDFWIIGARLTYDINRFLAAETGYNYDRLDSELPGRSFTRNRVFVGIRASY